jgi:hypothetical protein
MIKFSKLFIPMLAIAAFTSCQEASPLQEGNKITRYDRPEASILKGAQIAEGAQYFYTSGLVAPVKDADATPGTYERYGNTYEHQRRIRFSDFSYTQRA